MEPSNFENNEPLKEDLENNIDNFQKDVREKQEEIDQISTKLEQVKEEYNTVVSK